QGSRRAARSFVSGRTTSPHQARMDRRVAGDQPPRGGPVGLRFEACQVSPPSTEERGKEMRRKRFQKGSLQARQHGRHRVWVAFWWEDGIRRCKMLGRQSQMTK